MTGRGIPRQVRTFITEHLSSVAGLELLLLLHGSPQRAFSAEEAAGLLRIEPQWAAREMAALAPAGVVADETRSPPVFAYRPPDARAAETVDELARTFSTHRVAVITLLFSTPADGIGTFADAFKLRRKDDG